MKTQNWRKPFIVGTLITVVAAGGLLLAQEAQWIGHQLGTVASNSKAQDSAKMNNKHGLVAGASLKDNSELQACYEDFLKRQPQIDEGVVEVHWLLDAKGKLASLQLVRSDMDDAVFTQCLLDKIRHMKFHTPAKSAVLVSHKFNFHKRNSERVAYE